MPIMMKRKDGTITPFRNAEYLSAYYFIPKRILEQCGKELNSIPRNPQKLIRDYNAVAVVESDLFIQLMMDVVIVHSSLKSMGYVEGGADTVIDALLKVLGENGTLVMPTLIQKDFSNAYQTWNLDKPSDVGLITETFRKRDGVIRSDQATHSVAAFGPLKQYLTRDHGKYGKRMGPFGDTPFAVCSPWQKLYDLNAKALMIGVSIVYNTSKHLTEYMMINHILDHVKDDSKREKLIAKLKYHGCPPEEDKNRVWPYTSGEKIQEKADQAGLLIRSTCGNAVFTSFRIKDLSDYSERWFKQSPEYWYGEPMLEWLKDANEE